MAVLGLSLDPSPRRRDLERRCGRLHRATVHALFSVAKMFSFINCPSAPKKAAPRGGLFRRGRAINEREHLGNREQSVYSGPMQSSAPALQVSPARGRIEG